MVTPWSKMPDSDQMKKLKTMVREAILSSHPDERKEELFQKKAKKSRTKIQMPDTVSLNLDGTHVDLKVSGDKEALAVRMQPEMLQAMFDFLGQYCDKCYQSGSSAKRSYQKTGKYSGYASKKEAEDNSRPLWQRQCFRMSHPNIWFLCVTIWFLKRADFLQ